MINHLFGDQTLMSHHSRSPSSYRNWGRSLWSLANGGEDENEGLNQALNDQGEAELGRRRVVLIRV